jgi:HEPN domain-containing protein
VAGVKNQSSKAVPQDDSVRKIGVICHDVSVNRKEFQTLSRIRLREARALAELGMHDGAYYLAGYSVECALKACIAKATLRHDFPDKKTVDLSYTHNLRGLLGVAKLEKALVDESNRDPDFRNSWDIVQLWSEHSRYSTHQATSANKFLEAVGNRKHGILRWIKLHW